SPARARWPSLRRGRRRGGGGAAAPVARLRGGEADELLARRVPELEPGAAQRLPEGKDRDLREDLVLIVGALQVVVGDAGAQVVDVVEADVAGEELEGLRKLQVAAAAERRLRVVPGAAVLPVDVLELVLDEEQPDAGGPGDDDERGFDQEDRLPAEHETGDGDHRDDGHVGQEDAVAELAGLRSGPDARADQQ